MLKNCVWQYVIKQTANKAIYRNVVSIRSPHQHRRTKVLSNLHHERLALTVSYVNRQSFSTYTKTEEVRGHKGCRISVSIVGSGPSGCYTAKYLNMALKKNGEKLGIDGVDIDMIESLPTPFGLVRSGVAPDHPEVKNVENDFSALFESTSDETSIQLWGNVHVGKDISLAELRSLYDVVILAYGCESNKKLGIEGEDSLKGILSAREFVAWYNGHPDYVHIGNQIHELISDPENSQVVVIGQGNVALDCARILAKGSNGLYDTDIAKHSLPLLQNGVKTTTVLGRRGHVQGAFTIKELRELTKLETEGHGTSFIVNKEDLDKGMTPASEEELNGAGGRPKTRIDKLLRDAALKSENNETSLAKEIRLRFLLNPVCFQPDPQNPEKIGSIICEKTELKGTAGKQYAVSTGQTEEIPTNMVLLSIGYKGIPLPDMDSEFFDSNKGIVKNVNGKVGSMNVFEDGLYVSGWLKRGPSGIIGTNIGDSKDTVSTILSDLTTKEKWLKRKKNNHIPMGRQGLDDLLRKRDVQVVDWEAYKTINNYEKDPSRLRSEVQPREKIVDVHEMLKISLGQHVEEC